MDVFGWIVLIAAFVFVCALLYEDISNGLLHGREAEFKMYQYRQRKKKEEN